MKNPTFLFFSPLLREGSPPTPSAFVRTIVMAPLLMSLELTGCNDWRLEPLPSLIVLLNGELGVGVMYGRLCTAVRRYLCLLLAGKRKKKDGSAARNWRVVYGDRHASMLVAAAVQPDIRCRPLAVHLLWGIGFYCDF